jgi:two-component system, response regulator PdtaR
MAESQIDARPVALVVEDEVLVRMYACELLEEQGFNVLQAATAERALKVMEAEPQVRLLFTDIQMPGAFDGMDLARRVHARWPKVRLVITSGQRRPSRAEIPDDGRFLAKPYAAQELISQVNDLMRKS